MAKIKKVFLLFLICLSITSCDPNTKGSAFSKAAFIGFLGIHKEPEAIAFDIFQCGTLVSSYMLTFKFTEPVFTRVCISQVCSSGLGGITAACLIAQVICPSTIGPALANLAATAVTSSIYGIMLGVADAFRDQSFAVGYHSEIPPWSSERSDKRVNVVAEFGPNKGKEMFYQGGEEKSKCEGGGIAEKGENIKRCLNYKELAGEVEKNCLLGSDCKYVDTFNPESLYYRKMCVYARSSSYSKKIDEGGIAWDRVCLTPGGGCKFIAGTMVCAQQVSDYLCAEGVYCSVPFIGPIPVKAIGGKINDGSYNSTESRFLYNCIKLRDSTEDSFSTNIPSAVSMSCLRNMDVVPQIADYSFSGQIVRCIKETTENILKNQYIQYKLEEVSGSGKGLYGDDKYMRLAKDEKGNVISLGPHCIDTKKPISESGGICEGGFFVKVQNYLSKAIAVTLILAVLFFGVKVVVYGGEIKASQLILTAVKVGVIAYFALGTAWKEGYYDFLVDGAAQMGSWMIDNSRVNRDHNDGCFNYNSDGTFSDSEGNVYQEGDSHYAIWDAMDCKVAKYFVWGSFDGAFPMVLKTLMLFVFNTIMGIFMLAAGFIMMIFVLLIVVKATYMFLSSMIAIMIMIFFSPIFITLGLFERTKNMFMVWSKQLIGYSLQPVIILAFLSMSMNILDYYVYGNTVFDKNGNPTQRIEKVNDDGTLVINEDGCDKDSYICKFYDNKVLLGGKLTGDIPIPIFSTVTVARDMFIPLVIIAFIAYILFCTLARAETIATTLVGGRGLGGAGADGGKKVMGAAKAVGNKVKGAAKRGKSLGHKGLNKARGRDDYSLK